MQIGILKNTTAMHIWNIWIRVRPFPPTSDAHAPQTNDNIPRLRYNLFPLEDEDGEGTSEVGGALGPSHQQAGYYIEAPVSSSDDSMHIPDTGSTEVPETPSNKAKSRDEEI
ncbi:hypothetical protein EJB05_58046, partial [Eragrostis curvula]